MPLRLWIVETKPFPNSIQVDVKELQIIGFATTAPSLGFASLAAVNKKKIEVYCQKVEGRISDSDHWRNEFEVKVQLSAEQRKALWELLRVNVGKEFLLRMGDTNIWNGTIETSQSPKDPNLPHVYLRGRGLHQSWISADELKIDIQLRYNNENHANAMLSALQPFVKNVTEIPADAKTPETSQPPH